MGHKARGMTGAVVLVAVLGVSAAVVTIDESTVYQTIEGLGGHNPGGQTATLVDDLGLSAHRAEIMPDGSSLPSWSDMKGLADRGVRCFIACPWSPPAAYKTNNDVNNGGNLRPDRYSAYAQFLATWIKNFKQNVGVDLYAVCPQNEPRFVEPYRSCVYTPQTMRDFVAVLGAELESQSLSTKIVLADDMLSAFTTSPMAQVAATDPLTSGYVDGVSVHGYSNGVNPTPSAQCAQLWGGTRGVAAFAAARGLSSWMTETSGYWGNWTDGMDLASTIYIALKYGRISGWFWWRLAVTSAGWEDEALMLNGTKLVNYYVHKQYYRWIRPGAVQVESSSNDSLVHAVAFHHDGDNTLTVVVLNWGSSSKTVSVEAAGANPVPTQFHMYLSDASKRCNDEGSVSGSSVALPAKSIATLYATGYNPSVAVERGSVSHRVSGPGVLGAGDVVRVCALDGTVVYEGVFGDGVTRSIAPGSYWAVSVERDGVVRDSRCVLVKF